MAELSRGAQQWQPSFDSLPPPQHAGWRPPGWPSERPGAGGAPAQAPSRRTRSPATGPPPPNGTNVGFGGFFGAPQTAASYHPPFSAPPAAPYGRSSAGGAPWSGAPPSNAPHYPQQPRPGAAWAQPPPPQQPQQAQYGIRPAMPPARARSLQQPPTAGFAPVAQQAAPRASASAGPTSSMMAARPGSPLFPPSAFTAAAPPRAPLRPVSPVLAAAAAAAADAREAKLRPAWLGSGSRGASPAAPSYASDPFDFEGEAGPRRARRPSVGWDDGPPGR